MTVKGVAQRIFFDDIHSMDSVLKLKWIDPRKIPTFHKGEELEDNDLEKGNGYIFRTGADRNLRVGAL